MRLHFPWLTRVNVCLFVKIGAGPSGGLLKTNPEDLKHLEGGTRRAEDVTRSAQNLPKNTHTALCDDISEAKRVFSHTAKKTTDIFP